MRYAPILTAGLSLATGLAQAATPADACANLAEARTQLVGMIGEADAAKLDGYKAKVHAASDALDADLAAMAGGPTPPRPTPSIRPGKPSRTPARPRSFRPSMPATR
jgi:hypothetical protein